jgi:hypothetical protein
MTQSADKYLRMTTEAEKDELLQRMRTALAMIAYPRRGTNEESFDIQAVANIIRTNFSREELGI